MGEGTSSSNWITARRRWWLATLTAATLLAPAHAAEPQIRTHAVVLKTHAARGGSIACPAPQAGRVNYDGLVVRNPHVRRNLEALRCGLSLEGYGRVDVVVSGGESYVGRTGRIFSVSNHENIEPRNRRSAHNVENGARAVDLWRDPRIADAAFRAMLKRYTAFVSARGHYSGHWHLRLPARTWDCPAGLCSGARGLGPAAAMALALPAS